MSAWPLGSARRAGPDWPGASQGRVQPVRRAAETPMNLSPERRSRHLIDLAAAHASQCRRSSQWCYQDQRHQEGSTATGDGPLAGGVRSKS